MAAHSRIERLRSSEAAYVSSVVKPRAPPPAPVPVQPPEVCEHESVTPPTGSHLSSAISLLSSSARSLRRSPDGVEVVGPAPRAAAEQLERGGLLEQVEQLSQDVTRELPPEAELPSTSQLSSSSAAPAKAEVLRPNASPRRQSPRRGVGSPKQVRANARPAGRRPPVAAPPTPARRVVKAPPPTPPASRTPTASRTPIAPMPSPAGSCASLPHGLTLDVSAATLLGSGALDLSGLTASQAPPPSTAQVAALLAEALDTPRSCVSVASSGPVLLSSSQLDGLDVNPAISTSMRVQNGRLLEIDSDSMSHCVDQVKRWLLQDQDAWDSN